MNFSLSHIAEPLFAEMINRNREGFLRRCNLFDQADLDFVRSFPVIAECDARLERFGGRGFDGKSRVDVVVRLRKDLATGFELKLGQTGLDKNIVNKWLAPCTPSHKDRR